MKSLLKILYFLLFLVIVVLLAGLVLPKTSHIESSISINASPAIVFEQVNILKNWESWSPWYENDSSVIISYNDVSSGKGASYSWKSDDSGEGKLTITKSEPLKGIEALVDVGVRGNLVCSMEMDNTGKETKLTWAFDFTDAGYFERYFLFLFKKNMTTTINKGLNNIKKLSQELRLDRISEISIVDMPAQPVMCIIDSSSMDKIEGRSVELFKRLGAYLEKRNIQPTGPAFTIYYSRDTKGVCRYACCLPIPAKTWGWKEYSCVELPQGQAATLTHWGKFGSSKPYEAIDSYFREHNLRKANLTWEVRKNDPATESDTSKWETQLFYPVKQGF